MAVTFELVVNATAGPGGRYVGWSPAPAALRVLDPDGATQPIRVVLTNRTGAGGKLVFRAEHKDAAVNELRLELAVDGTPSGFFVAGAFGSPSLADRDAPLQVRRDVAARPLLATFPMMVRVRKDANRLTTAERDRFLGALALLNSQGAFQSYRDMHLDSTDDEGHGNDGFLPWHRAYLLDLERELQRRDPSVTLPYWRFDRPAPRLFSTAFLGITGQGSEVVRLAPSNPLQTWMTDGQLGIRRRPRFDAANAGASNPMGPVLTETATIALGSTYQQFASLNPQRFGIEVNPHGRAHECFTGYIRAIGTAARDPLFFLLHCNVDRLWAIWQWQRRRFDTQNVQTYRFQGRAGTPGATRIGHNMLDTLWSWNDDRRGLRPRTAPRTPFPAAPAITPSPGPAPTVQTMIDFQGHGVVDGRLGFDYADVPFQQIP